MSCYFQNDTSETLFTVKQAAEMLDLGYGRNTFYKNLKQWGYLSEDNRPSPFMVQQKLMLCREKQFYKWGSRMGTSNVPLFTKKGLWFIQDKIEKDGLAKN